MKPAIITIDGPAGVGKSTLGRLLAGEMGLAYLDTGAMFRFLALKLGPNAPNLPETELRANAGKWHFTLAGAGADTRLLVNGEPIGDEIRTEEAAQLASLLGANEAIRKILREAQQEIGRQQALVAEGRDLGTVVFPEADVKFFLEATPRARAERRWQDLRHQPDPPDLDMLERQIAKRDQQDRERPIAPLKPAQDAIIMDTTHLSLPEVFAKLTAETEKRVRRQGRGND